MPNQNPADPRHERLRPVALRPVVLAADDRHHRTGRSRTPTTTRSTPPWENAADPRSARRCPWPWSPSWTRPSSTGGLPLPDVQPKAYRFRILNAADDRFFNLQLYVADPRHVDDAGWTDGDTEVKMVPAVRDRGFPRPGRPTVGRRRARSGDGAGPSMIQIGTEGGFLPAPVVLPNQPIDWNLDQTTFNFGQRQAANAHPGHRRAGRRDRRLLDSTPARP